jgi:hypothetical protein
MAEAKESMVIKALLFCLLKAQGLAYLPASTKEYNGRERQWHTV